MIENLERSVATPLDPGVPAVRSGRWALLLAFAILSFGVAAGVWKHMGLTAAKFSILYVGGKAVATWGAWGFFGRRPLIEAGARSFWAAALTAALFNGFAWIAYFVAFARGPLALVQSLSATYTAVAALLAVIVLGERLSRSQIAGVALVIAAGALLGYVGEQPPGGTDRGGWIAATVVAVACWGMNGALVKYAYGRPLADDYRMYLAHWVGLSVTVLPFGLYLAPRETWDVRSVLSASIVVFLYVAGDLALYAAAARGPAAVINPLIGLYPIPSIAYAALFLGYFPDGRSWAIIFMSLCGVLLIVRAKAGKPHTG